MWADLITRLLMMVLGYAYPAFECFKTVEKNKVQIEELRFWCRYWIIVALITIVERIGDTFISWVPMYSEIKLALFLYLWYPKTKGTGYVYETLLRPFVAKHETDIDRSLQEARARAWDLAIYYYHNCSELGQSKFFQMIEYFGSQSGSYPKRSTRPQLMESNNSSKASRPPPPNTIFSFYRLSKKQKQPSDKSLLSAPNPNRSKEPVKSFVDDPNQRIHRQVTREFDPHATKEAYTGVQVGISTGLGLKVRPRCLSHQTVANGLLVTGMGGGYGGGNGGW